MKLITKTAALIAAIATVTVALVSCAASDASATSPALVTVCKTYPCANAQELTVSDHNGAPIFSVPEYGPVSTWGADFQVSRAVYAKPAVSLNLNGTITIGGVTLTPKMIRFLQRLMRRAH